jgi:hypothetical protein
MHKLHLYCCVRSHRVLPGRGTRKHRTPFSPTPKSAFHGHPRTMESLSRPYIVPILVRTHLQTSTAQKITPEHIRSLKRYLRAVAKGCYPQPILGWRATPVTWTRKTHGCSQLHISCVLPRCLCSFWPPFADTQLPQEEPCDVGISPHTRTYRLSFPLRFKSHHCVVLCVCAFVMISVCRTCDVRRLSFGGSLFVLFAFTSWLHYSMKTGAFGMRLPLVRSLPL